MRSRSLPSFLLAVCVSCAVSEGRPSTPSRTALRPVAGAAAPSASQVAPDAVLLRMPDVSADSVVFRFAGDLWLVPKTGGEARPLSSPDGNESWPKFSPDGRTVAFVGGYDGGGDLYTLGVNGGVPNRVTHHPTTEILCDWHPSGEELIFFSTQTSDMTRAPMLYRVSAAGGQAEELPVPFGTFGVIDDGGEWLAYTPTARTEFRTWKRYQGGRQQDVWLFNLGTNESRKITDHPGTDALPMWHGSEVVFVSDRGDSGRLNLWAYDVSTRRTRQLTDFADFDVRWPSIGPDDVVFENGGKLYRYEFASSRSVPVPVTIPTDRPALRPRSMAVGDQLADMDIGPSGKRVVVEARGELFTVPVDEGYVRNLTNTSGEAERSPAWSPDGKWIAYFSDASGEYEVWVRRSDGKRFQWMEAGDEVAAHRLTDVGAGWKTGLQWAPDSKSLLFQTNDASTHHVVLETGALTTINTNPSGFPHGIDWSRDSRWLAWSHVHPDTQLSAVYLFDLEAGERHVATSGLFADDSPTFDRNGDWLYYHSVRTFQPIYSEHDTTWIYANGGNLMAVPLREDVENPFAASNDEEDFEDESEESDEDDDGEDDDGEDSEEGSDDDETEEVEEEASEDDDSSEDDDDEAEEDEDETMEIDLDGFEARALRLPVDVGRMRSLQGGDGKLFYLRMPRTGEAGGSTDLVMIDPGADEPEEKEVLARVQGYALSADGKKILAFRGRNDFVVIGASAGQKADDKIDTDDLRATIDPRQEWNQILDDAGRLVRDFFYEETLHGVDWDDIVERYRGALADATNRDDLHYLIGEMIAELNVGHAYNRAPSEGLEQAPPGRSVGLLGVDWELEDGAYRIARILTGGDHESDARGPLSQHGVDAAEGDWLLAVNGTPVDTTQDVYAAFVGLAGKPTELTLNAAPTFDGEERRVIVTPMRSENGLRYRAWVEGNRRLVDEMSGGRIGYVHVPDTGRNGQNELVRQFMGQFHKDALLVDERWNGGGQIPTRFIELLDRPVTNYWAIRHGEDWTWPPVGHRGPKAMLINESSGSGGDAFPYYFRQSGLGKLIGTRTWGGLVGISGNPQFIDGSSITVPRFAFYEKDGTWGVEGHGVDPDIEVVADPALMVDGSDPQLLAGIRHLMSELEGWVDPRPARPASPDRSGSGIRPEDR